MLFHNYSSDNMETNLVFGTHGTRLFKYSFLIIDCFIPNLDIELPKSDVSAVYENYELKIKTTAMS